jgi:hypothetical protein
MEFLEIVGDIEEIYTEIVQVRVDILYLRIVDFDGFFN